MAVFNTDELKVVCCCLPHGITNQMSESLLIFTFTLKLLIASGLKLDPIGTSISFQVGFLLRARVLFTGSERAKTPKKAVSKLISTRFCVDASLASALIALLENGAAGQKQQCHAHPRFIIKAGGENRDHASIEINLSAETQMITIMRSERLDLYLAARGGRAQKPLYHGQSYIFSQRNAIKTRRD